MKKEMLKRSFTCLMAGALVVGLTACGNAAPAQPEVNTDEVEGVGDLIDESFAVDPDEEPNPYDSAANVNPDIADLYDEYGSAPGLTEGVDPSEIAGEYAGLSDRYGMLSISIFTDGFTDGYTMGTFEIMDGDAEYTGDVVWVSDGLYALEVSDRVFYTIVITNGESESIALDLYNLQDPMTEVESMVMVEHFVS